MISKFSFFSKKKKKKKCVYVCVYGFFFKIILKFSFFFKILTKLVEFTPKVLVKKATKWVKKMCMRVLLFQFFDIKFYLWKNKVLL